MIFPYTIDAFEAIFCFHCDAVLTNASGQRLSFGSYRLSFPFTFGDSEQRDA